MKRSLPIPRNYEKLTAQLWFAGRSCRILITNSDGDIVEMNDQWNNSASAESWLLNRYPRVKETFVRDPEQIRALNHKWDAAQGATA